MNGVKPDFLPAAGRSKFVLTKLGFSGAQTRQLHYLSFISPALFFYKTLKGHFLPLSNYTCEFKA